MAKEIAPGTLPKITPADRRDARRQAGGLGYSPDETDMLLDELALPTEDPPKPEDFFPSDFNEDEVPF